MVLIFDLRFLIYDLRAQGAPGVVNNDIS